MSELVHVGAVEVEQVTPAALDLFETADPVAVVKNAKVAADALADIVKERQLYKTIGDKDYILVDAWTLLGSMLGVFPVIVWTKQLANGWEARAEARTRSGEVVGAAESECRFSESLWKNRDSHALRGMAQTRAISRALRLPLGFIIQLAGYDPSDPGDRPVVNDQHAKLAMVIHDLEAAGVAVPEGSDSWTDYSRLVATSKWGVSSRAQLSVVQMSELIEILSSYELPFG